MIDKVTIIIPTLGRSTEIYSCLDSINNFGNKIFEVIIVDQNCSSLIDEAVDAFKSKFKILHCKVYFKGASKARNYAAEMASGEYLFFMDDDAELFPNSLELAIGLIERKNADVVFGKCVDRTGLKSVLNFEDQPGFLSLKKHGNMFVESTMLVKKVVFLKYQFDEGLGVGTFHGAEEGYDIVLRMLNDGVTLFYDPSVRVYHPQKITNYSESDIKRVFSYRCGYAKLCHKHRLNKTYYSRLFQVALYLPYVFIFNRKKFRYYLVELCALVVGRLVK